MNINLFNELISYISGNEESSYLEIWGSRLLSRFRGQAKTFVNISVAESVNTKRDYEVVKFKIAENESLDDLLLMCDRGIKKYDETGSFFKWFRIIIIAFGLLLVQGVNLNGNIKIDMIRGESQTIINTTCTAGINESQCRQLQKYNRDEKIKDVIFEIKVFSFIFFLVVTIAGFLAIAIISNDNKGRVHLEILALYVNRLKQERESKKFNEPLL